MSPFKARASRPVQPNAINSEQVIQSNREHISHPNLAQDDSAVHSVKSLCQLLMIHYVIRCYIHTDDGGKLLHLFFIFTELNIMNSIDGLFL